MKQVPDFKFPQADVKMVLCTIPWINGLLSVFQGMNTDIIFFGYGNFF